MRLQVIENQRQTHEEFGISPAANDWNKGTPASGVMGLAAARKPSIILTGAALTLLGTSSMAYYGEWDASYETSSQSKIYASVLTTTQGVNREIDVHRCAESEVESTRVAVNQLRRLSGLTWDELAKIFNVSRRSVHFWATGKKLTAGNEIKLQHILATIRRVDLGSAEKNRTALRGATAAGRRILDLLTENNLDEVIKSLGVASPRSRIQLSPLSLKSQNSRKPLPPDELVDAIDKPAHRRRGKARSVRTARVKK